MNSNAIKSDYFVMFLSQLSVDYWLQIQIINMQAGYRGMRSGYIRSTIHQFRNNSFLCLIWKLREEFIPLSH